MFVQVFVMIRKPRLLARSSQPTLKRVTMPHAARIRVGLGFGEGVRWSNATVSDSLTFSFYRTDVSFATNQTSSCKDV